MNDVKKTPIEEAQGINGFLVPEQVLPSNLIAYYGSGYPIVMTVHGSMVEIEGKTFFRVERWQLGKR